jgi:hypothetical protein
MSMLVSRIDVVLLTPCIKVVGSKPVDILRTWLTLHDRFCVLQESPHGRMDQLGSSAQVRQLCLRYCPTVQCTAQRDRIEQHEKWMLAAATVMV